MVELTLIALGLIFLIGLVIAYFLGHRTGKNESDRSWEKQLPEHRRDAIMRSRSVLSGNFSEQLAPYLPDFEYSPTECRFIGKPIDFIVFKGMDEKKISEVVFVEVKSGNSKLSAQEKNLKETIKNRRVKFVEYKVPEDLTKKKDSDEF